MDIEDLRDVFLRDNGAVLVTDGEWHDRRSVDRRVWRVLFAGDDGLPAGSEVEGGELSGRGVMVCSDGWRYEGEVAWGMLHGRGVHTHTDGLALVR